MNRKGFTLVELLASLVILGLLMGIAIPNVVGTIRKQRKNTYIEDAKRLVTRARTMISANNLDKSSGTCYSLRFLDNGDFSDAPNGGKYLRYYSFVRVNGSDYYVTLVECTTCKNIGQEDLTTIPSGSVLQGIKNRTYNNLIHNDSATSWVTSLTTGELTNTNSTNPPNCSGMYYHPDKAKR